jgi:hypothetical protein
MPTTNDTRASLALILAAATDLDSVDFFLSDSDRPLTLINEAGSLSDTSAFFLAGFEFGPSWIIHVDAYRGAGFEPAYEAWVDALPEIDAEDLPEAYTDPRDEENRTFDDIARERMHTAKPCPQYHEREAWESYQAERKALAKRLLEECVEAARANCEDWPEVAEGYREDSNGRVKDLGHYENFYEADLAEIEVRPKAKKEG